jgi:hypothetical protein
MIGRKKLSVVREELQSALAPAGDDPIRWLENLMHTGGKRTAASGEGEVLKSLRRFLKSQTASKKRGRRPRPKK